MRGVCRVLAMLGLVQGLGGCMAGGLYQSIEDHPFKENYDFDKERITLPKFDDAATQPVEFSYRVSSVIDKKQVTRFVKVVSQIDFSQAAQEPKLPLPVKVEQNPRAPVEQCPRQIVRAVVGPELPVLEMVRYEDLMRRLAPCTSGYVIFSTYTPTDDYYRLAAFKVDEGGVVKRSYVDVPGQVLLKDYGNMWGNVGKAVLIPVALAGDITAYAYEWAYMAMQEN